MRLGSTGRGLIGWASLVMCSRRSSARSLRGARTTGRPSRSSGPGFDLDKARQQRADEGKPEWFGEDDLYPDVRPALARLQDEGLWVGIAGNQTARAGSILRGLGLPADMIATSDDWGVSKPDPGFFRKMIEVSPCRPG